MRISLAVALSAVLLVASSAGAGVILNFDNTSGYGFYLQSNGVLAFDSTTIENTDPGVIDKYIIQIGSLTIDPHSRATYLVPGLGTVVTYAVTTPAVTFQLFWSGNMSRPTLEGTLGTNATNTIAIFDGGTVIFDGSDAPANLTSLDYLGIPPTSGGIPPFPWPALAMANQAGLELTLGNSIDAALQNGTALNGDLSGSISTAPPAPEPATMALTGLGLMALFVRRRK